MISDKDIAGNKNWTEDLDICQFSGCGQSINQVYLSDGRLKEAHVDFDKKLFCCYNENK
jgi:hypothetical protein